MTDREEIEQVVYAWDAIANRDYTELEPLVMSLEALLVQARKQVVYDCLAVVNSIQVRLPDGVDVICGRAVCATLREEIQGAFGGNTVSAPAHKKHVDKSSEEAE